MIPCLLLAAASAQQTQPPVAAIPKPIVFSAQDTSVHAVFSRIAAMANLNVIVTPSVTGQVTVNLRDLSGRDAIHAVAGMVGAEVREERGIMTVSAPAPPAAPPGRLRINLVQMPIGMVVETIRKISGRPITIDAEVKGVVTLQFSGIDVDTALQALAAAVGATVRTETGVTWIAPAAKPPAPLGK